MTTPTLLLKNINISSLALFVATTLSAVCFFSFASYAHATHEYCGNTDVPQSLVSTSGDYSQGSYYGQNAYYSQNTYYVQATYYLQGGYWPAINDVVLTVDPILVRAGETTTVTWNGGNASMCTLTGAGLNISAVSGSQEVAINGEAVISVTCNLGPNISTSSTTVKIIPSTLESFNDTIDHFKNQVAVVFSGLM